MKKRILALITLAMCIALCLCLASCGGDDEASNKPAGSSTTGSTAHTHSYGEWTATKMPTCTEGGVREKKCSCGDTKTEELSALGHDYVYGVCKNCSEKEPASQGLVFEQKTDSTYGTYYELTGLGDCSDETVYIPSYYEGFMVKMIGEYAFAYKTTVKKVVIPNTVIRIKNEAFASCEKLEEIEFAKGSMLEKIGERAFEQCNSLLYLVLPSRLQSIGTNAFNGCGDLISVFIPSSVASIGQYAFQNCYLATIYCEAEAKPDGYLIGWNIRTYNQYCPVLWGCLTVNATNEGILFAQTKEDEIHVIGYVGESGEVVIPEKIGSLPVTTISASAFRENIIITSVSIPGTVKTMGLYAFLYCTNLKTVVFNEGITSIPESAFKYCDKLEAIALPNSMQTVGKDAFCGCTSVTSLSLGTGITTVEHGAFSDLESLSGTLTIPGSLKTIGDRAFEGSAITALVIEEGVTSIGDEAFSSCSELLEVSIPSSVKTMGHFVIAWCHKDIVVNCNLAKKPAGWNNEWYYNVQTINWLAQ